jgi:IS5 family transposase
VWLSEVEGGIVSGFWILEGNAGDEAQLEPALEDHLRLFARAPELVAADRNVHSKENELVAKEMGVKKVCLPKAGKKSTQREEHERQRWFKRARRFRAGIEGRISVMKRREYLGRCRDRGEEGFGRWVGWGVLTANLSTIAQTLMAR